MRKMSPKKRTRNQSSSPSPSRASQWALLVTIVLPILGIVWLIQGAYAIHREALPQKTIFIDAAGCHMPTTVLDPPDRPPVGSAVVFHGLSANRRVMLYLGQNLTTAGLRVYIPDLSGHGDNTDAFSFARAHQCAIAAVEYLIRNHQIDPATTILVGHSMGAAIAIAMADREPLTATIAISPGPVVMPRRMPANLLVFVSQFDIPAVKRQAAAIADAAGANRVLPDDFAQDRAFHLETLARALHTSGLYSPEVISASLEWIRQTLTSSFARRGEQFPEAAVGLGPFESFAGCLLGSLNGLLGLLVLFLPCVAIAGKLSAPALDESGSAALQPSHSLALAEMAVAALLCIFLLKLYIPLRFLHIYSGDYLASLFLLVAVLVLAFNRTATRESWKPVARQLVPAAVLGFVAILAIGRWLNWQLDDAWMNSARWLRFVGLLPVALLYCYTEEILLGPVRSGRRRALRYLVALLLRAEICLACALAYFELNSGEFLIILLVLFFALFSLLQRLSTDALRRRVGSAAAAALFGAILLSWFIAAVLPLS